MVLTRENNGWTWIVAVGLERVNELKQCFGVTEPIRLDDGLDDEGEEKKGGIRKSPGF